MVKSLEDWKSSRSVSWKDFPNFDMLDAKIASALNKIIKNSHFKKKVSLDEQKAQKEDPFLRGRQIAFMTYNDFRVTGVHDTALDYADLFSVTIRDDNVQEFDTRWDEVLLSMWKIPSDDFLESLYNLRKTLVRATQNRIGIVRHGDSSEKIDAQLSKIDDDGEEKYRSETSIAKYLTPGAGVLKQEPWSRIEREWVALKEEKVLVTSGMKKGQCSKGDQCSFQHESHNRVDFICRVLARDRLVNIDILPSVNSTKLKWDAKPGMSVCSRIIRLMNNQTKSQRKASVPTRGESDDKTAVAIVKICLSDVLYLARLGSIGFSMWKTVPGKPDARSPGINSKSAVHAVYASSSKYRGKRKDHRLEKYKSKCLISEVATQRNLRTERQTTTMCPKQGVEPCQKTFTGSKKRTRLHSIHPRKNGTAGCLNKRAGRKRVCGGFPSYYAYGQQERP